jgi:predicted signal transduction protein with EAL and GGDEF domain
MATEPGGHQPYGMRVPRNSSATPPLAAALRRATVLLAPAASLFAVGALGAGFVFSDPAMNRTAAVLLVGAAIFAVAWWLLARGLVRPAALLLIVTLLVLPILFAAVQPPTFASFPLVPLLGVAFALPFLEGRRLAALMALACLSAAGTAAIQSISPRDDRLPTWFFATFNVLGLLALVGVFLLLLAAFSNRLHRSLRHATESTVALAHQATHDSLTGLANRQAGLARAQAVLDGPSAERAGAALLYIDVDEFKRINDTLGHLAGDALLERVGQRIAAASSLGVTARPGGDEFIVVVVGPADDGAAETIAALRSLGASIVIDDFGTGYSALDYLKRFVVDGVKIDRSFIAGLGRLGPDEAIVTASIAFAHALGLEVTAEGIETRAQLDRLADLGCDRGQGYLIRRPTRIEEVVGMLLADRVGLHPLRQIVPPLRTIEVTAVVG